MFRTVLFLLIILFTLGGLYSQGPNTPLTGPSTLTEQESIARINELDRTLQAKQQELKSIQDQAYKLRQDGMLEKSKGLDDQTNQLEQIIKDLELSLNIQIKDYRETWDSKPWWQQVVMEVGPQYTFFNNTLKIDNAYGLNVRFHILKPDFKPFTLGYLYYPFEKPIGAPYRQVIASPLMLEYRHLETTLNSTKTEVTVSSYLIGYGLFAQIGESNYLSVSLGGGLQSYQGTKPNDTGPIISYTIGIDQFLGSSKNIGLGLNFTADLVRTSANTHQNQNMLNPSSSLVLRLSF